MRARGEERIATLRGEMARAMEDGCGIYRSAATLQSTCERLAELKQRYRHVGLDDHSRAWNTEWLLAIELGYLLDVAQAMAHSALERRESRGSHHASMASSGATMPASSSIRSPFTGPMTCPTSVTGR